MLHDVCRHHTGMPANTLIPVYDCWCSNNIACAAPSMSHYLNQTSKVVLEKYKGDLDNLRKEAKHDPVKERELVKAFKVCSIARHQYFGCGCVIGSVVILR